MDEARHGRELTLDSREQAEPVETRHVEIRQEHVARLGTQVAKCLDATFCHANSPARTQRSQRSRQASHDGSFVVDQQDLWAAAVPGAGLDGLTGQHVCTSNSNLRASNSSCRRWAPDYGPDISMEPGLVTLAKIVGTLLAGMGIIPLLFLLSPGERGEPEDRLDSEQKV